MGVYFWDGVVLFRGLTGAKKVAMNADCCCSCTGTGCDCGTCPSALTATITGATNRGVCTKCGDLNATWDLLSLGCTPGTYPNSNSDTRNVITGGLVMGLDECQGTHMVLLDWAVYCDYYPGDANNNRFALVLSDVTSVEASNWEYRFPDGDDMSAIVLTHIGFNGFPPWNGINNCLTNPDATPIVTPTVIWTW